MPESTITMRLETVTAQKAKVWLEKHNTRNRSLRERYVKDLARAMAAGEWQHTHAPIAFNCDGTLLDGQHRLAAIALSGVSQRVFVARGLTDEANLYTDTQARRSDADALTIAGTPTSRAEVSVAKAMIGGPKGAGKQGISRPFLRDFLFRHEDAIAWAIDASRTPKLGRAPVIALLARAYYHEDHGKLSRFRDVYLNGAPNDTRAIDAVALRLREFVLLNTRFDWEARVDLYCRSQSAVSAYCRGVNLKLLKPTEADLYPLPV